MNALTGDKIDFTVFLSKMANYGSYGDKNRIQLTEYGILPAER